MTQITKKKKSWTRRAFMITGGVVGTGLVVGAAGMLHVNRKIQQYSGIGFGEGATLNAWVHIAPDNTITLAIPRAEMGQGVYTSLPMLVAEELEVDLDAINVMHPQPESPYSNLFLVTQSAPNAFKGYSMMQKMMAFMTVIATGGSTSLPDAFENLRYAGATAREMLKEAAAKRWNVDPAQCTVEKGYVINLDNQERLSYGALAAAASEIELDELPTLKSRADWKILGKPAKRLDVPAKIKGEAVYGIDVRPEGLLYAAVKHPTVVGGSVLAIKNGDAVSQMPGVRRVLLTDYGAAVVADNTWRARKAVLALELEENDGGNAAISTENLSQSMLDLLDQEGAVIEEEGIVSEAFDAQKEEVLESTYSLPYLAHAAMEPLNCTVKIGFDDAEVWVGHQGSSVVQAAVSEESGVDKSNIRIHTPYLGGGFGRKGESDFVRFATAIALQMQGVPIMTVFSREEDTLNDFYRPAALSTFKAIVEPDGEIAAWENKVVSQPVGYETMSRLNPGVPMKPDSDGASVEGAAHLPYLMQSRKVTFNYFDSPVPVGFWRSVGSSTNAFFTECFIDECAAAAGMDPYAFRRARLANHPRFLKVLDTVAEMSQWQQQPAENTFRGLAIHKSFGSIVGQVAEISRAGNNTFSIDKYYCAVDCGTYVSPDIIESQMAGGIIFGLSAALYGEITWKDGAVVESNFPQYPMVKMNVAPEVDVEIIEVDAYPGGVGEPGTPPAAPALVNALFAATGERIRSLPLSKQGYSFV